MIIFQTLGTMEQYLVYCFNCRQDITDKTEVANQVIEKFKHTVNLLLGWEAVVSEQSFNFCVRFNLYEILQLTKFKDSYKATATCLCTVS